MSRFSLKASNSLRSLSTSDSSAKLIRFVSPAISTSASPGCSSVSNRRPAMEIASSIIWFICSRVFFSCSSNVERTSARARPRNCSFRWAAARRSWSGE